MDSINCSLLLRPLLNMVVNSYVTKHLILFLYQASESTPVFKTTICFENKNIFCKHTTFSRWLKQCCLIGDITWLACWETKITILQWFINWWPLTNIFQILARAHQLIIIHCWSLFLNNNTGKKIATLVLCRSVS